MFVLGIETSCDETSASIVADGRKVLSNVTVSSVRQHRKYGGVIPEIAFRMQLETIAQVTEAAIEEAGIRKPQIGLVCVTQTPGLLGSLLVGVSFAQALGQSLEVPVLGVNHILSHIYAGYLQDRALRLPFAGLIVSGGHTSLYAVKDFDRIELLGSTQDDACGESFDKVAKIIGLGYPGGPEVEKAARQGDRRAYRFSCSNTARPFDFSYSGIKTAVLYHVRKATRNGARKLSRKEVCDIAASFQENALEVLVAKSVAACRATRLRSLVVGGGVAANNRLREMAQERCQEEGIKVYFPSKPLCMDNAAMVAGFGYQLFKKGATAGILKAVS